MKQATNMKEQKTMANNIVSMLKEHNEIQNLQKLAVHNEVFSAEVIEIHDEKAHVRTESGEVFVAEVMLSCLVEIALYDRVLVLSDDAGKCYISGVLSRLSGEPLTLMNKGRDVLIKVPNLSLQSGMLIMSATELYQSANEIKQCAERISVASGEYEHTGKKANIHFAEVSSVVNTLTTKIKFLFEKLGLVSRTVDQIEKIDSNMRQDNVRTQLTINAGNTQINSRASLQMNARQIFMS